MIAYDVSSLVAEVKVILDRNQESSTLVPDDSDTLTQGELIEQVLLPAVRAIEQLAPADMLGDLIKLSTLSVTWSSCGVGAYMGKCTLPEDLLRIISVMASDWYRPGTIIMDTDKAYVWQKNSYVRGNKENPVVAITHKENKRTLELYSSSSSNVTADMAYLLLPDVEDGKIYMSQLLHDSIVYMAASLVCDSIGDTQTAASLKAIAYQLANIETTQTE